MAQSAGRGSGRARVQRQLYLTPKPTYTICCQPGSWEQAAGTCLRFCTSLWRARDISDTCLFMHHIFPKSMLPSHLRSLPTRLFSDIGYLQSHIRGACFYCKWQESNSNWSKPKGDLIRLHKRAIQGWSGQAVLEPRLKWGHSVHLLGASFSLGSLQVHVF